MAFDGLNPTPRTAHTRSLEVARASQVPLKAEMGVRNPALRYGVDYDSRLTTAKVPPEFKVTEKRFTTRVVTFLRSRGWHVQRNGWIGTGNQFLKGFPDLVCVREVVLFVELKRADGTLRPPQQEWRDWVRAAGGNWELWRPQDWADIKQRVR